MKKDINEILTYINKLSEDIKSYTLNDANDQERRHFEGGITILLALRVVESELILKNVLSDETVSAVWEIISRLSFEQYRKEFPQLYSDIQQLQTKLAPYTDNMFNADIPILGHYKEDWLRYFEKSIRTLLLPK